MAENLGSTGMTVVGVADLAIGAAGECNQIVTYALGSCIGLTAYDPVAQIGGLLHYMLPQPSVQQNAAEIKPSMFATTGLPILFRRLLERGTRRNRLVVCAAGAAQILTDSGAFAIGRRNHTMLREIFSKDGTVIAGEDIGGDLARTMTLDLSTGTVAVKTRDGSKTLWSPEVTPAPVATGSKP